MEEELMIDGGAANTEDTAGDASGTEEKAKQPEQPKKYTDAEVDKIIARKIAAERQRMQKVFNEEQQESDLDKRERKVLERELKADAKDALIEQGLPSSLSNLLSYGNKEDMDRSLDEVGQIFKEAVRMGIKDTLRGHTPRTGTLSADTGVRDAFAPKAQ